MTDAPVSENAIPRQPVGSDTLSAVLRGPESVFVYWTLEGPRSAEVVRELGPGLRWVLRVLNLSDATSERIPVDGTAGNFYVTVRPGLTYAFELAAMAEGHWRTVARTGRVVVPRIAPEPAAVGAAARWSGRTPVMTTAADAAVRGMDVPGLHAETTPMITGSSPGIPSEDED